MSTSLSFVLAFVLLTFASCEKKVSNTNARTQANIIKKNDNHTFFDSVNTEAIPISNVTSLIIDEETLVDSNFIHTVLKYKNLNEVIIFNKNSNELNIIFTAIADIPRIKSLTIKNSGLDLMHSINKLKHIKFLNLNSNESNVLNINFINNINLDTLYISEQSFVFSDVNIRNSSLKFLSISGYSKPQLSSSIFELNGLKTLSVTNSDVSVIGSEILKLRYLSKLVLLDCPISRDTEAIRGLRQKLQNQGCEVTTKMGPLTYY